MNKRNHKDKASCISYLEENNYFCGEVFEMMQSKVNKGR